MKTKILKTILLMIISLTSAMSQTNEQNAIEETIRNFAKSADIRNDKMLEELLDVNFRLALNQLFGSKDLVIVDKQTYLNKIRANEFGGDSRTVTIEHVFILGNNAMARATFKGNKMSIETFLQLIKTKEGKWKIIHDLPSII